MYNAYVNAIRAFTWPPYVVRKWLMGVGGPEYGKTSFNRYRRGAPVRYDATERLNGYARVRVSCDMNNSNFKMENILRNAAAVILY